VSLIDDAVLDPFVGSGTTVAMARRHSRVGIGLDISWPYLIDHALARGDGKTSEKSIAELPLFAGG
jgi:DNA modification methylase